MAPFYERELGGSEKPLRRGDKVVLRRFGPKGAVSSIVEILSDKFAFVTPATGTFVYVGKTEPDKKGFVGGSEMVRGKTMLEKESVSNTARAVNGVFWRKK